MNTTKQIKKLKNDLKKKDKVIRNLQSQMNNKTPGDNRSQKEYNNLINKFMNWLYRFKIGPRIFIFAVLFGLLLAGMGCLLGLGNDAIDFYNNVKSISTVNKTYQDGYDDGYNAGALSKNDDYIKGYTDAEIHYENRILALMQENKVLTDKNNELSGQIKNNGQKPNSAGKNK